VSWPQEPQSSLQLAQVSPSATSQVSSLSQTNRSLLQSTPTSARRHLEIAADQRVRDFHVAYGFADDRM
jgi:hypothetical protein